MLSARWKPTSAVLFSRVGLRKGREKGAKKSWCSLRAVDSVMSLPCPTDHLPPIFVVVFKPPMGVYKYIRFHLFMSSILGRVDKNVCKTLLFSGATALAASHSRATDLTQRKMPLAPPALIAPGAPLASAPAHRRSPALSVVRGSVRQPSPPSPVRATMALHTAGISSRTAVPLKPIAPSRPSSSAGRRVHRVHGGSTVAMAAAVVVPGVVEAALPQIAAAAATSFGELTMGNLLSTIPFATMWLLSIVPCCLGFINPVYVFSVGYGLAVASQAAGLWVGRGERVLFTTRAVRRPEHGSVPTVRLTLAAHDGSRSWLSSRRACELNRPTPPRVTVTLCVCVAADVVP